MKYAEIFEYPIAEFSSHLNKEENERILFSGKYGMGKTSFLKEYFSGEKIKNDYEVFHLYPVNYSIAANEDIIQFVKHDIILQLLNNSRELNESSKGYLQTLPAFIKKNLLQVATTFIYFLPKIGKDVIESYDKWNTLIKSFLEFHDEENKKEGDQLIEFLLENESKAGGLFENDIITNLIINMIRDNKGRKSVLIVDDIDRLDPEHVFRIMNVFAAHFDNPRFPVLHSDGETILKNKFGFDKIILVCDLKNIQSLFSHKFGGEVDFAGYSNKFYSSEVFHFDNKKAVNSIIGKCLDNVLNSSCYDEREKQYFYDLLYRDRFLFTILQFLVSNSLLTLRNILKINSSSIDTREVIGIAGRSKFEAYSLPDAIKIKILQKSVGDADQLKSTIQACMELQSPFLNSKNYFGNYLFISKVEEPTFSLYDEQRIIFEGKSYRLVPNKSINNEIEKVNIFDIQENRAGSGDNVSIEEVTSKQFWQALILAITKLKMIGYIK